MSAADSVRPELPQTMRATFIVRLAREARSRWRGEVEYVQRGERRSTEGVAGALAQVAAWLEAEDADGPGGR